MLSDGDIITVGDERFRCESFVSSQVSCDVDIRVNFNANVVLFSSPPCFQEIGECMTKAADSVGCIHDVPSSASLSSVFVRVSCGTDVFFPCCCRTATP